MDALRAAHSVADSVVCLVASRGKMMATQINEFVERRRSHSVSLSVCLHA